MAAATDHGERLARVEGAYQHLATKADVERLRADLSQDIERVRSELKGMKWIIGVGIAVAGVAGPVVTRLLA